LDLRVPDAGGVERAADALRPTGSGVCTWISVPPVNSIE